MKFELWQLLLHVTSFAVILGVLFSKQMPIDMRLSLATVVAGLMVSLGPATLPRPELRAHVPNDGNVRRWSDVLVFGLPASLMIWIGLSVFLFRLVHSLSVLCGLVVGALFFVGYCCWAFLRHEG